MTFSFDVRNKNYTAHFIYKGRVLSTNTYEKKSYGYIFCEQMMKAKIKRFYKLDSLETISSYDKLINELSISKDSNFFIKKFAQNKYDAQIIRVLTTKDITLTYAFFSKSNGGNKKSIVIHFGNNPRYFSKSLFNDEAMVIFNKTTKRIVSYTSNRFITSD
jgi:hypothetical protein